MVVFSYYPADPRVRRAAEALVESGIITDVFCLRDDSELKREIVNGVEVYRLPVRRKRGGKLRYILEYACFIFLAFFILTIFHIHKCYSIVHVHNMPDILIFSALIPRLCGSKIILDLHDPMPEVYMTKYSISASHPVIRLLIFFEKLSIWFSSLVLTPNIAFRDLFISRGCPEFKIKIVMNSPDEKIFSWSPRSNKNENVNNDQLSLMYHGTIVERNGLDIALVTLNKVRNKIPKIVFHVYGKGEFVKSFLKLKEQLKLDDIVFYHGQVSQETIAKEIESIDVGLIPNKRSPFTDINMPTRIFEYLCKGKPVIAPRTKGILDYFENDYLYFFEPGRVKSLAEAILDVYSNPERRCAVVARGISIYQKYRWQFQCQYFVGLVARLLGITTFQAKHKKNLKDT